MMTGKPGLDGAEELTCRRCRCVQRHGGFISEHARTRFYVEFTEWKMTGKGLLTTIWQMLHVSLSLWGKDVTLLEMKRAYSLHTSFANLATFSLNRVTDFVKGLATNLATFSGGFGFSAVLKTNVKARIVLLPQAPPPFSRHFQVARLPAASHGSPRSSRSRDALCTAHVQNQHSAYPGFPSGV